MSKATITSDSLWEKLAILDQNEVASFFAGQCAKHHIPIPTAEPTLAEILSAIDTHLSAHRRLPICDYAGGEPEWRIFQSDLCVLQSALQKVISQISRDHSENSAIDPGSSPEPQPFNADPATACATACAGARPPRNPRASAPPEANDTPSDTQNKRNSRTASRPAAPQPSDQELAPARAEYLAGLLRERTSRSPLDDLPIDRQKILFELLEENPATLVHEMLSQPAPLGWGLQTSHDSLKRFRNRQRKRIQKAELASASGEAAQIAADPNSSADQFTQATDRIVQMHLFHRASDNTVSVREIYDLSRAIDRRRRTNLTERKLNLDESKAAQQP